MLLVKYIQRYQKLFKHCHAKLVCNKSSGKSSFLWPIPTDHLFKRFRLDVISLLNESSSENKYIPVTTKYYTRSQ